MSSQEQFPFNQTFVWRPSEEYLKRSRLKRFMDQHGLDSFEALIKRSTTDITWFWEAVIKDLGIEFYEPFTEVVNLRSGIQWPSWCVGAKLNIVHNCLDKWMDTPTQNRIAIRWEGEEGSTRLLTYLELKIEVDRVASGLRAAGLGKGDVIALFMPMVPEIVIALLAIAKIGAIILPLFSGFGASAIATRLEDGQAKAIFTADGMFRRGSTLPMKSIVDEVLNDVPTVRKVIVYPRTGLEVTMKAGRDMWWEELIGGENLDKHTERTDAEDIMMIIYTSGTSGKPKGAVHTHCGFPIKSAQDMAQGFDIQDTDTMFWVTDMGWMMGPWQVFGVLLLGASMLLYDGAADYPEIDRVWDLVERHGVTTLGIAPTYVRSIMLHGDEPVKKHNLSTLRIIGSTGEVWNPISWLWLFEKVGKCKLPIINYSGGTEISGGILMGNALLPLKPCAFSGPAPGMAVDVVDADGNPVRNAVGELVIRQPWIGMTRGFWRDPERYIEAYWSRFPGVWVHGDFAAIDQDGLWYILGRSDDTIKVAGKRVGPAEVESVMLEHPGIAEAAALGVPDKIKGEVVVVFVVLKSGYEPNEVLRHELNEHMRLGMGKSLAPKEIHFVSDIPKTRNAKVMRRVIRAVYLGQDPGDLSALVNPEAIHELRKAK